MKHPRPHWPTRGVCRPLAPDEVRELRVQIARAILDTAPREEWDRYVLDTEPETAAMLKVRRDAG